MKLNLTILATILKDHNIKGQGYSHRLVDNVDVVQDYIRSINRSAMVAPVGAIRVLIVSTIGAVLAVGRLNGIENAMHALDLLQQQYNDIYAVNFSHDNLPIRTVTNFCDVYLPVIQNNALDIETIAGAILWFCDARCRYLLELNVDESRFYALDDDQKERYAILSVEAINVFNSLRAGVESAVQLDPLILQNIDATSPKKVTKYWSSV
ncbi:MAG TPA: hypothetical protein VLG38_05025 [Gammaproteobacteria bacterium]|nr:hypothetical protein [Gammaproteobacteria bacterium]